jgi:hypothetical protein
MTVSNELQYSQYTLFTQNILNGNKGKNQPSRCT